MDKPLAQSRRTTLARHPERTRSTSESLYAVLDEAWTCHVGVVVDDVPVVMPTMHVRIADTLYLHGARQNRQLRATLEDRDCCVTASVLDGLVYAERAFHHSMNYRSAVVFGRGREVDAVGDKRHVLTALLERFGPGRAEEALAPSERELAGTLVVALSLAEASVKVRDGGTPASTDEGVWTGVVPLRTVASWPAEAVRSGAARQTVLGSQQHPYYDVREGALSVSTRPELLDLEFVHEFLSTQAYWAKGLDMDTFTRALAGSLCFGLRLGDRSIGFARVVLDGARIAYLADVFIGAEQRGRGYGKWLVAHVLAHPELAGVKRVLLGTRDAHALYTRFGFRPAPDGVFMTRDLPVFCPPR